MSNQPNDLDINTYLEDFTPEELEVAKDLIASQRQADLEAVQNDLYRVPCPTPKEFIDDWIGDEIKKGLFPFVIDTFLDVWEYEKNYSETVLYGATRTGKSVLSRLCIVYCVVFMWCLKDPHTFFGINKMSSLAIFLMSFSKLKAKALLLKPVINILKASPKFHQVIFEDQMEATQERLGNEKIVWTTADKLGEIGFSNDIHICLGASPLDIIGADIIMALITEINFFIEAVGVDEETVWRVYTDTKDRIFGTIGNKYGTMIILDSSANNRDSLIESYIMEDAVKDPQVYYLNINRWSARPELYKKWLKTGDTFDVFVGDNARSPAIVSNDFIKAPGDDKLIIQVPIDARNFFKKNIYKSLKDHAGIPAGSDTFFFPDWEVFENLWDHNLINVTNPVETPMAQESIGLIMDQVKHVLFKQDISGKFILRRAKSAPRWVAVDLSETENRTGLAICHPELRDDGTVMCVFDLAMDIRPGKEGINLDAVLSFIRELYKKWNVYIAGVSSDRPQSSFIKQAILKDEKEYTLVSVDREKAPYIVFKTKIMGGALKVGQYSHILNNLKSLVEYPDKIDHTVGKNKRGSEGDMEIGKHSKDISDAMASSCFQMYNNLPKHAIAYNYDDINRIIDQQKSYHNNEPINDFESQHLFQSLMDNINKVKKPPKPMTKLGV